MATSRGHRSCVLKCTAKSHFHAFPKDEIGKRVWLKQLGLKQTSATSYVCDLHFSNKMKPPGVGVKLTPWAIPDINLPVRMGDSETDEDDYYVEEEYEDTEALDEELEETENTKDAEAHLNGYSTLDANNPKSEDLDFDELLARVHCISDLTNNNKSIGAASYNGTKEDDVYSYEEDICSEEFSSPVQFSTNGSDMRVDKDSFSAPSSSVEMSSKLKKKLIASVRKRRILYDPAHPSFSNIEKKSQAWERIAKILKIDATACREMWLKMRYAYQNHVRGLRQWLAGDSSKRERPRISFENDLLFLWRYIIDKGFCDGSDEEVVQARSVETHEPVIPDVPICNSTDASLMVNDYAREVDHPYANFNANESVQYPCNLIEAVKYYSELFDPLHPNFGDPKRRSIIWDAISNELNQKATKCLQTWIELQLRYEFEIMHNKSSYLVSRLNFLKKHILINETSPFKKISSPADEWHEPMKSFKEQHLIIQTLVASKKYRSFIFNIDVPSEIDKKLRIPCWAFVGRAIKRRPEQCEITWIVMQTMYCELSEFRRNNCLLRDEWDLEAVITNLLASLPSKKLQRIEKDIPLKESNTIFSVTSNTDTNTNFCDMEEDVQINRPSSPKVKPLHDIQITVPSPNGDQVLRFNLDMPVDDLREKTVVSIDSVLKDAHVVVLLRYRKGAAVFPFTLEKRRELIGEVMARPLLFNGPCKHSRLARIFWGEISIEMGYPAEICMFFWEYIHENSFFMDYDPSWKKNQESKWIPPPNPIFDKFQKYADSKDWGEYISILPDFIQEISNFPLIYVDLKINATWNRRQCHARDIAEVWTILARKFAVLENHKVIWDKFKQLFLLYMSEIELSIYNAWPQFWYPVLEKLTFLYKLRYDPKDPIYYVIKWKIQDELEEYKRNGKPMPIKLDAITNGKAIFGLLKEKEYLDDFSWVNRSRFLAKIRSFPMLYDISHAQFGNKEAKLDAWQEMALSFHCAVGECHLIFQHLMKSFLLFRARDPNQMCRVNAKYWENMTYIYSCAIPNAVDPKLLEWRSFRPSSNGSTIKLAEEYQAEISLVDAKLRLILKNYAAAVNSLPIQIQSSVVQRIKCVFGEYTRFQNEEIVVDV